MLREYLKSIADAIRTKLGSTDTINAQNFPSKVNEVYDKGRTDGISQNLGEMVSLAQTNPYDVFWDLYQDYGNRTDYNRAFYTGEDATSPWTDETFKPKYSIRPTSANRCFYRMNVADVAKAFEDRGVVLDTSQCTNAGYLFAKSNAVRLPTLDLSRTTIISGIVFISPRLEKIDKIIWGENINPDSATNPFLSCSRLAEFESAGTLAVSVSFASCPLTVETIKGLILCLKNYAGTSNAGTYTLTLSDTSKTAMANLGAIAEFGGKTYDAYLTDIGWNLA